MILKLVKIRFEMNLKKLDEGNVLVFDSASEAAERADAIVVLTEWDEFINLDWESIYEKMRKPAWILIHEVS